MAADGTSYLIRNGGVAGDIDGITEIQREIMVHSAESPHTGLNADESLLRYSFDADWSTPDNYHNNSHCHLRLVLDLRENFGEK